MTATVLRLGDCTPDDGDGLALGVLEVVGTIAAAIRRCLWLVIRRKSSRFSWRGGDFNKMIRNHKLERKSCDFV